MFDIEVERAWIADTEWWCGYTHEDFKIVEDIEIPDWLEEERYEEYFGAR